MPIGGVPTVEVFLRDPSSYLRKFQWKPRKTPKSQVDKRDRGMNLAPPVKQFLSASVGVTKTDSLTSMPYPVFEPRTIGSAAGFPNHFTAGRPNSIFYGRIFLCMC